MLTDASLGQHRHRAVFPHVRPSRAEDEQRTQQLRPLQEARSSSTPASGFDGVTEVTHEARRSESHARLESELSSELYPVKWVHLCPLDMGSLNALL